jgi:hypothetical protein
MSDRISDPWGERTPYGAGEEWPVRVDEHLPAGEPERWAQAASLLHSNGDAMDIAVAGGRVAGLRGRAQDRVNRGRLDPKDVYGRQANHAPDRLTRPLANPLPLGFLALAAGTLLVSGLQLEWLKPSDGSDVALILIAFVFPLQLVVSVFGFLARDVAAPGMGILAGTWLSIGLVHLTGELGSSSDALGLFLLPLGRRGGLGPEPGVREQL